MACFQRVEELQFHKTFCLEQLIVFHLPSIKFLEVGLAPRKLAAWLCCGIIGRSVVLQELIHCLKSLIVLIENLQILNRR